MASINRQRGKFSIHGNQATNDHVLAAHSSVLGKSRDNGHHSRHKSNSLCYGTIAGGSCWECPSVIFLFRVPSPWLEGYNTCHIGDPLRQSSALEKKAEETSSAASTTLSFSHEITASKRHCRSCLRREASSCLAFGGVILKLSYALSLKSEKH